jgi:hypothetical protein
MRVEGAYGSHMTKIADGTEVTHNGQHGYVLQSFRNWYIAGRRWYVLVLDNDTVAYATAAEMGA